MTGAFLLLAIAIIWNIFDSSMLQPTNEFKCPLLTIGVILSYSAAFYALSLTLQLIEIGIVYPIWSGVGTAASALIGSLLWNEAFVRDYFTTFTEPE